MSDKGKRLNPRIAVNKEAILADEMGGEVACTLLDLSSDGFRAKLGSPHNPTTLVKLVCGDETYDIEIRWATGLEIGGRIL
ncbi:hypothetical protein [Altererythrobacter sp.]|uniref:hypothetical protein n=1 Tax=Altererythrobacter sp. TaxID=1872480 RepID=UPI003D02407F